MQDTQQLLFNRPALAEVEHEDLLRLPDAMDTAHALLDAHGIPRKIEIDYRARELQIPPLAAGARGQQDIHLVAKLRDRRVLLRPRQIPAEERIRRAAALADLRQVIQCRQKFSKDHHLARPAGEHLLELQPLRAMRDGCGQVPDRFELSAVLGAQPGFV